MKVTWEYALEKAGQLGHVAYRHRKLECTFERSSDRQRFAEIWRRHTGKTPVFESSESNALFPRSTTTYGPSPPG
jgi:hypothetical protein